MSARTALDAARCAAGAFGFALALVAADIGPLWAGGPLAVFNHQPVVYPNGGSSLALNLDQGPLGSRTNAQAIALVQNAIALWNGVGTSTARVVIGPPLGTDYTVANYSSVLGKFSDGLNPVLFDSNGAITDAIFGSGSKNYVLGFAGSAYATGGPSAGKYLEGQAVLNGFLNVSDATWTVVLAHELGHFIGLDHSQLDASQGLASNNYVLMYPIAYRTLTSLHEDDVAAVTSLYPTASVAGTYGQLNGTFTSASGTPVLGANIWAEDVATGRVYSVVSDFLMQSTGYFDLYVPAGTYNLFAESIDPQFNGGSSVGPYANTATDVSFQPPHPIAPVALGAATPLAITIVAGCVASATFRLDGSGSVGGNCVVPLNVTRSGNGAGIVTSVPGGVACGNDCSESYAFGTAVTLTASPSAGSTFSGWTGACTGASATCAMTMTAAKSVNAAFAASSSNANLTAMSLSAGTLSPAFASGTASYVALVGFGVSSISVTSTTADASASIKVNGSSASSGNPSNPISLAVGHNSIFVVVTAANAITTMTYTIDVVRAQSNTTTVLASSANPVAAGTTVTLTATVTGLEPTGVVSFASGGSTVAGCGGVPLVGASSTRIAQCVTSPLGAGVYSFVATFEGDALNAPSSGSVVETVNAIAASLDVDASTAATEYDALTDGLLVVRYLFNLRGTSLTAGALGPTATRTDPAAIAAYLDAMRPALDVDGDGIADALTDGLLIERYLFGVRGASLTNGALGDNATRTTTQAIEAYIQSLLP